MFYNVQLHKIFLQHCQINNLSVIKEFCRKNVAIFIFISHTVVDYKKYMIKEFSEFLERQTEIYNAYFCEQDLIGNIDDFMNQTISLCQLLIFCWGYSIF